jgi:hypothetical protein
VRRLLYGLIGAALMVTFAACTAQDRAADGRSASEPATSGSPAATATSQATPRAGGTPSPPPAARACTIFPPDNVWHAAAQELPVHRNSAAYVASIGAANRVHADFGSGLWEGGPIGIPITVVPPGQGGVRVTFEYASESDKGPYPIPRGAKIEGGPNSTGDRHVILLDRGRCRSYELFAAYPQPDGAWRAGSGAIFDLRANAVRPRGWTSADAAGLSILAGLVRYEEVAAGRIDHAIRVTVPRTRDAYVWPASHSASDRTDPALPPMGLRLRLKSSVDISGLPRQARIVAEAMQRYGVIVADNGSPWYISGAPDERWDNDALHALGQLRGSDFEAVDTSGLMISVNSTAARAAPAG